MIGQPHRTIAFSIVLAFGVVASQSGLAKGAHAPQAHSQHTSASTSRANSVHAKPAETIDTRVTVLPPRGGVTKDKPNLNTGLKIVKPEKLSRRSNVTGAIESPVARNAIGQPVKSKTLTANAQRFPSLQGPSTVTKSGPRVPSSASPVLPLNVGRANVHPTATASNSINGRIDGARLIRPSVAPLGVGGPARASNGINGRTVQTKHY